ncbi:hypothetical protein, partial [Microcoleus sp. herbarium12]|uniref:hypothetical protein n=1 Tax=Microcoleus sp. herbarium12 TaxID=3055437 RepID=UPI002FD3E169
LIRQFTHLQNFTLVTFSHRQGDRGIYASLQKIVTFSHRQGDRGGLFFELRRITKRFQSPNDRGNI